MRSSSRIFLGGKENDTAQQAGSASSRITNLEVKLDQVQKKQDHKKLTFQLETAENLLKSSQSETKTWKKKYESKDQELLNVLESHEKLKELVCQHNKDRKLASERECLLNQQVETLKKKLDSSERARKASESRAALDDTAAFSTSRCNLSLKKNRHQRAQNEIESLQASVLNKDKKISELENLVEEKTSRLQNLEQQPRDDCQSTKGSAGMIAELTNQLAVVSKKLKNAQTKHTKELATVKESLLEKAEELDIIAKKCKEQEKKLHEQQQLMTHAADGFSLKEQDKVQKLESAKRQLEGEIEALMEKCDGLGMQLKNLENSIEKERIGRAAVTTDASKKNNALKTALNDLDLLQHRAEVAEAERLSLHQTLKKTSTQLEKSEQVREKLETNVALLKKSLSSSEGEFSAKMQALMEDVEYLKKSLQESEKEARLLNEELAQQEEEAAIQLDELCKSHQAEMDRLISQLVEAKSAVDQSALSRDKAEQSILRRAKQEVMHLKSQITETEEALKKTTERAETNQSRKEEEIEGLRRLVKEAEVAGEGYKARFIDLQKRKEQADVDLSKARRMLDEVSSAAKEQELCSESVKKELSEVKLKAEQHLNDIKSLNLELNKQKRENDRNKSDLDEALANLDGVEKEKDQLSIQYAESRSKIDVLSAMVHEKEDLLDDALHQLKLAQGELANQGLTLEEKEAARSRLQTLLEETNVQLSNMTKAHNASTLELNRLKEERESLLEELRKGQESMDKEKSELMEENKANEERMLDIIDELEEEKEKLEEELEQRKHALSELKEQLCEAQSTIDTLQSSLSLNFAEKNRDLQAMKSDWEQREEKLQDVLRDTKQILKQTKLELDREIESRQLAAQEMSAAKSRIAELEESKRTQEFQLSAKERDITAHLDEQEKRIKAVEGEKAVLKRDLEEAEALHLKLESKINRLTEESTSRAHKLQDEINIKEQEIVGLQAAEEKLQNETQSLVLRVEGLEEQLEQALRELEVFSKENASFDNQVKLLTDKLEQADRDTSQNAIQADEVAQRHAEAIAEMAKSTDQLTLHLNEARQQRDDCSFEIDRLTRLNTDMQDKLVTAEMALGTRTKELFELSRDLEECKTSLTEAEELQKTTATLNDRLKHRLEEMRSSEAMLSANVSDLEAQVRRLSSDLDHDRHELGSLQRQLARENQLHEREVMNFKNMLAEAREKSSLQVGEAIATEAEKVAEIRRLQEEVQSLSNSVLEKSKLLEEAVYDLSVAKKDLETESMLRKSAETANDRLEEIARELKAEATAADCRRVEEIRLMEQTVDELSAQIEDMSHILMDREEHCADLAKELEAHNATMEKLNEHETTLKNRLKAAEIQRDSSQSLLEEARADVTSLTEMVESLRTEVSTLQAAQTSSSSEMFVTVQRLDKERMDLEKRLADATLKLRGDELEIKRLEAAQKHDSKTVDGLRDEVNLLSERLDEACKCEKRLRDELRDAKNETSLLHDTIANLKSRSEKEEKLMKEKIDRLEGERSHLQRRLEITSEIMDDFNEDTANLLAGEEEKTAEVQRTLKTTELEKNKTVKELEDTRARLKALEIRNSDLLEQLESSNKLIRSLEDEVATVNQEFQSKSQNMTKGFDLKLASVQDDLRHQKAESTRLRSELKMLQESTTGLHAERSNAFKRAEVLDVELQTLKKASKQSLATIQSISTMMNMSANDEHAKLLEKLESLLHATPGTSSNVNERVAELEAELAELQEALEAQEEESVEFAEKFEGMMNENRKLEDQVSSLKRKLREKQEAASSQRQLRSSSRKA